MGKFIYLVYADNEIPAVAYRKQADADGYAINQAKNGKTGVRIVRLDLLANCYLWRGTDVVYYSKSVK